MRCPIQSTMNLWIVQMGEAVPELDGPIRPLRCAMLTRAATDAGHTVVRWTSTLSQRYQQFRAKKDESRRYGERLEIRMIHGPGYKFSRSPQRLWHHRVEAASFLRQARDLPRPDLVFCCLPTPHLCQAAVAYGRAAGVPVVIDVRDPWPLSYLKIFPPAWRTRVGFLLAWEYHKLRGMLRRSAGITAISNTFLDWALRHARRPAGATDGVFPIGSTQPDGDPAEELEAQQAEAGLRRKLNLRADEFVIAFIGSLVSSFDLETVVAAARQLEQAGQSVRFVVAGSGGQESQIRKLAADLPSVNLLGWVRHGYELTALLRLADAGLAPYRLGCTMSLPNKPFEYMAAGLPQLSSLRGEMADIIERENIGINYRADDPQDLQRAIRRLMDDSEGRRQQAENARRLFLREFAAGVIYPRLVDHLLQMVGSPGHGDPASTLRQSPGSTPDAGTPRSERRAGAEGRVP